MADVTAGHEGPQNAAGQPEIRYSATDRESDILADRRAARMLAQLISRGDGELAGDRTADPRPYQMLLGAIRVARAVAGKVVLGEMPHAGAGSTDIRPR